jgi:hypothetical protein
VSGLLSVRHFFPTDLSNVELTLFTYEGGNRNVGVEHITYLIFASGQIRDWCITKSRLRNTITCP